MVYVVRRKLDDFYLTKNGEWVQDIDKSCWLDKEQITDFKNQQDSFLVYTILNPCEKINS